MDDSILLDIKKMLGIGPEYTAFDTDIIANINAAIGVLNQLGIGVDEFFLMDATQTWNELVGVKRYGFQIIKQYIYLKVKNVFDPPTSGVVLEANNALIKELEYRLNVLYECKKEEEEGGGGGGCGCNCKPLTEDQLNNLINDLGGQP